VLVTQDLFLSEGSLQSVPVPDADILYLSSLNLRSPPETLLRTLIDEVHWRALDIMLWGKKYPQPRLVAWYGDCGRTYTYSGLRLDPLPWTDLLSSIRQDVQRATGAQFNSVLLNYYRHHNDSMGLHSDNEAELGPQPTIASVSLGDQRTLILKHKKRKELKTVKLPLQSGSLLVMKGDTQRHWKHGIDKESRACGPRVNLTFRRIFPGGHS
jgi:alkylated DNA repair dioxygenase AlkB